MRKSRGSLSAATFPLADEDFSSKHSHLKRRRSSHTERSELSAPVTIIGERRSEEVSHGFS